MHFLSSQLGVWLGHSKEELRQEAPLVAWTNSEVGSSGQPGEAGLHLASGFRI